MHEIENLARERGLRHLELIASINAESFYAAQGYEAFERTQHMLGGGQPMAAVRMRKNL